MSKSAQDGYDNIKTSELATTDETMIHDNLVGNSNPVSGNYTEATKTQSNSSESFLLLQDEIQMTLTEFNQKIDDNDKSIKRIEESMAVLYNKLDRTSDAEEESITSSKKKLKNKAKKLDKKGKKAKKLDKKGKKAKKLDKKGKKAKKLDKKGKKEGRKITKLTKAKTSSEKKKTRRTSSTNKNNKGRMKNASKKK